MKHKVPLASVLAAVLVLAVMPGRAPAQSLKSIPVPEPPALWQYIRNDQAAIQLGKALFWDMQVGSDGMTACATCHAHAGVDNRTRNTVNPGMKGNDTLFNGANGPNSVVAKQHFPYVEFNDPSDSNSGLLRPRINDVVGSQGVPMMNFVDIVIGSAEDLGTPVADPVFNVGGVNVRQVTDRNTPTVINAVYNFSNFWDGHANNVFNGESPFGAMDSGARVYTTTAAGLAPRNVRIRNGSLASQAMAPPVNSVEMSWNGRTWSKIGKKMLSLRPLAKQVVHPQDSVLGVFSKSGFRPNGLLLNRPGITMTYFTLIRQAFLGKYWSVTDQHLEFVDPADPGQGLQIVPGPADPNNTNQFTQMEANFDFFFGMAVQRYLSTLISDESPFDEFSEEVAALGFSNTLNLNQQTGMATFTGIGQCNVCHAGPEFTAATVGTVLVNPNPEPGVPNFPDPRNNPPGAIELMPFTVGDGLYDVDFLHLTVVPVDDDPGRHGTAPFINPLTGANYPFGYSELALLKRDRLLPAGVANFTPSLPVGFLPGDTSPGPDRVVSEGAFKTPSLRNVALTGPYFHNGGMSTLMQVIDFYSRGGNFPTEGELLKPAEISPIITLRNSDVQQRFVIEFLQSLTDPRVAQESGPFDHPQLFVPQGLDANGAEIIEEIPAIGTLGRLYEGKQLLTPFLNVDNLAPKG